MLPKSMPTSASMKKNWARFSTPGRSSVGLCTRLASIGRKYLLHLHAIHHFYLVQLAAAAAMGGREPVQ
jgi:hypothetical protein